MIDQEIRIVQETWFAIAKKDGTGIGELYYARLFEKSPHLRNIFNNDVSTHGKKFTSMLSYLINKLEDSTLIYEARNIGKEYANYGLIDEDYEKMKEALFWVLREQLGEKWNTNVMVSWIWFFSMFSFLMKDAARNREIGFQRPSSGAA